MRRVHASLPSVTAIRRETPAPPLMFSTIPPQRSQLRIRNPPHRHLQAKGRKQPVSLPQVSRCLCRTLTTVPLESTWRRSRSCRRPMRVQTQPLGASRPARGAETTSNLASLPIMNPPTCPRFPFCPSFPYGSADHAYPNVSERQKNYCAKPARQ